VKDQTGVNMEKEICRKWAFSREKNREKQ